MPAAPDDTSRMPYQLPMPREALPEIVVADAVPQDERLPPRRAPRLGEHTDEVLAEVLRLSSAEIGKLHDAGTVAGPTAD